MERDQLVTTLDNLLEVEQFQDYCPNGLQVEGRGELGSVVTAVTASLYVIERAVERNADMLLVHHGLFWSGDDQRIVGPSRKRLKLLLENEINLVAYHLPLDAHPELGNNAQWAAQLGCTTEGVLEAAELVQYGELSSAVSVEELEEKIKEGLRGRNPLVIQGHQHPIKRIGWCSGGAEKYIVQAAEAGLDAYLTGEISERSYHEAMEREICFFSCGHHATERGGVQALGRWISQQFGIEHHFIDEDNPV
ncbi:MAG: Nif3-like dinuclear metal center hexameric protein [Gammaproteobacteria bacterium]|uniref:GTP cyclohydrolase 1 type 2 homolog n=1 Tax=Candidatus Thiopontia autotrophica TaxID=2841688 RepID=A0A8J6NWG2_9GAMM|nr:Nif3-like dinuclear metal center hexameric protein [Candidatus Thiopontia autotrophica]MBL6969576.1 Nif3-like dinuclear metal center hexameric protein [Gammaproteobacteria bacterium]